ncbi:MAG: sugar transferase [Clostridia bacterium]|nr:sugar transferase [Clostridia bacterium]
MYVNCFKRIMDLILSSLAIIILSPVFLIVILAIKIDNPGPVFFVQERIGKNKKHFNIYKFRTMKTTTPKDTPTHLLENPQQYITKVGAFLRKTSLDELPQIFNILIGDMSIVGPRPALWNQFDLIELRDTYGVNNIRPGLTGWAQINGRDELSIEEKVRYDVEYLENLSFGFDIKCFFATIFSVLKSDGVVEGGIVESKEKEKAEV